MIDACIAILDRIGLGPSAKLETTIEPAQGVVLFGSLDEARRIARGESIDRDA